uniref:Prokineticin receptor 2-like n=1 Tax=Saccoglossus kowalevskii TaxID=10224 RepID=A0ABM0MI66_SACKO|nr:PREDICTED: prokineticin receptor 2-like [Saccoglossus kowalevskii]
MSTEETYSGDWEQEIVQTSLPTQLKTAKIVTIQISIVTTLRTQTPTMAVKWHTKMYYVIFHPLKPRLQKGAVIVLTIFIWVVSILITLPTPMKTSMSSGYDRAGNNIHYCGEYWGNRQSSKAYIVFLTVVEYIIPMGVMTFAYINIIKKVWFHRTPGQLTNRHRDLAVGNRKKTIRMLVTVVVSFGICWGPYHGYNLAVHFHEDILQRENNNMTLFYIVECIAMCNNLINTVIYFLMNDVYRKECWGLMKTVVGLQNVLRRRSTTTATGRLSSLFRKSLKISKM